MSHTGDYVIALQDAGLSHLDADHPLVTEFRLKYLRELHHQEEVRELDEQQDDRRDSDIAYSKGYTFKLDTRPRIGEQDAD